jgi:hypothetical protein
MSLIQNKDTKRFLTLMGVKKRKMQTAERDNLFEPPNSIVYLEKLGQILKRITIRDCYLTKDKFGQVKGNNLNTLIKPNIFIEQNVYLQSKKHVEGGEKLAVGKNMTPDQRKREKELKSRILKWPSESKHKQLKGMKYRVKFEEIKKGRPRAVFLKSKQDCTNLRNHVILKKLQNKDSNVANKLKNLALMFKVKQAEYFYEQELKSFLKSSYTVGHIKTFNNELAGVLEDLNFAVERTNRGGDDKSEFRLGKYKHLNKLVEQEFEDKKKIFATRIDMHLDVLDSLGDVDPLALGRSPYRELDSGVNPDARQNSLDLVKRSKDILRIDGLQADNEGFDYLRMIVDNTAVVVKLEKLIVERTEDTSANQTIYEAIIRNNNAKEPQEGSCNSYKSTENKLYCTYELDASIFCEKETFNKVEVTIQDMFSEKTLFFKEIDLMSKLERVHLENTVYHVFDLNEEVEGADPVVGVMVFNIVLFPTNLEIAHLLCPEDILEKQFDQFEHTIKNISDFLSYRENFFQKVVQKNKHEEYKGSDLFYFRNKFIDKRHFSVQFQDDSLASCNRFSDLEWLRNKLGGVLSSEAIDMGILISDNIPRLDSDVPFGEDFVYDLYLRACWLFAPSERLVINKAMFGISNVNFFENTEFKISNDMKISREHLRIINKDLTFFFRKMNYLTLTQKEVMKNITHRVFFFLDNNVIGGKKYNFHYSKHYLPLIASIVLINEQSLTDKDLVLLCINAIFSTVFIQDYTYTNHINYLSYTVAYFKFLFKKLYPEQYIELTKILVDFDMIIAGFLFNSFADVFDHISTNIYMDLKILLELLFGANEKNINLIGDLKNFGMRLSTFVDVMFLLQSFAAMYEKFKFATEPHQIRLSMKSILVKQIQSTELTLKQIIQLVEYVSDNNFFDDEFKTFREGLTETHLGNAMNFMHLKTTLRKANLKENVLQDIIRDQLVKNNVFCLRLQSMYRNMDADDEEGEVKDRKNKRLSKLADSGYNNDDSLDEDIFFEVAEEGQPLYDEFPGKGVDATAMRYLTCMVYLNNMDMNLLETVSNQHKLKANLNNIFELNEDEFETMVLKYVNISRDYIPKLFEALCKLSQSPRVPVLKFIILLILSVTEDFEKSAEHLSHFIYTLSSIIHSEVAAVEIGKNTKAPFKINDILYELSKESPNLGGEDRIHFSEVVKYVITEVASMTPFNLFTFFTERLVDVQHPQVAIDIKHAKLHLNEQVIDITELCIRHHVSSTYSEGRPCLLFNQAFNDWMTDIFSSLIQEEQIDQSISKFDVFLEVYIGNKIRHYRIPFRIVHVPEIAVFCKQNHRIYFDRDFESNSIFPKSTFVDLFSQMPYNFMNSTQVTNLIPTPLFNSERKLILHFNFNGETVLKVSANFKDFDLENPHDLQPWSFKNPQANQLKQMNTGTVEINMPFSVFFLPMKDLIYHMVQLVLPKVKEVDIFKMIKLFMKYYELSTVTNKKIDTNLMLSELNEYIRAMDNNIDLNLKISIKGGKLKM